MSIPNLANVLRTFEQPITLQTIGIVAGSYGRETEVISTSNIDAVVQVQKPDELKISTVDFDLEYIRVHSRTKIVIDQRILYHGRTYKVIPPQDWSDYGYYEVVGEQVRGA